MFCNCTILFFHPRAEMPLTTDRTFQQKYDRYSPVMPHGHPMFRCYCYDILNLQREILDTQH